MRSKEIIENAKQQIINFILFEVKNLAETKGWDCNFEKGNTIISVSDLCLYDGIQIPFWVSNDGIENDWQEYDTIEYIEFNDKEFWCYSDKRKYHMGCFTINGLETLSEILEKEYLDSVMK